MPKFRVKPPADESEVAWMERKLKRNIPRSYRNVLLSVSGDVCIEWQFPDRVCEELPKELRNIFAGECQWRLASLPELEETYQGWIDDCFSDPKNPYDKVWHNKFPIAAVGNGDMLAIDVARARSQPVVYLSHDDSQEHGYWLGKDFQEYVDRLTLLGCVGSECWQFTPFLKGPRSFLQTNNRAARAWRKWLGLEFAA